ncbi:MAG: hypothetical protein Q9159_007275 [Coniocarpon cinnabarinum]
MEALASIVLAGNVLPFVQLGLSIATESHSFKRSHDGALKQHRDLQAVVVDLDKQLLQLDADGDDGLKELANRYPLQRFLRNGKGVLWLGLGETYMR